MHVGSISTAFSSLFSVPPREESSREERGLLSRTAAGNRADNGGDWKNYVSDS